MHNHTKHLPPFLYSLSIAIVFGVTALTPNCAHGRERISLSLAPYTITPGVSDQVPVTVKLNWIQQDTINLTYTAYDSNNVLILNSYKQVTLNPGGTFNDTIVVSAASCPVNVYAEAQGVSGQDDEMQQTQLTSFTCPPPRMATAGPRLVNFGAPSGMDQYAVLVGAVSTQQLNNVVLYYPATGNNGSAMTNITTIPPQSPPFSLAPNVPWSGQVGFPDLSNLSPVMLKVQYPQGTTIIQNYQLGTNPPQTGTSSDGTLTLTAGPTVHLTDTIVPISQVTVDAQHPGVHTNMKLHFSARDDGGNDHECTPTVVSGLTSTAGGMVTNAPSSVTIKNIGQVNGRVTLTAILALYDNGPAAPPSFIEPATTLTFGP